MQAGNAAAARDVGEVQPAAEAPGAAPPADGGRLLDRSFAHGLAWTSAVKWTSQVLTWVSTLLIARLLSPEDYGLVGMATLYLGLITLMSEAGIGSAIVIQRDLSPHQIRQLNTLALGSGALGFLVTLALAGPIGAFFEAPRLPLVVAVMGVTFVFTAFRVVPQALLNRDMRFKALALIEGSQAIVSAVLALGLAAAGAGYWALVFGPLGGVLFWSALMVMQRPEGYARPHWSAVRPAITLSRHILVSRIAWYVYSNADFLIVGKFLGQTALGFYSLGWSLATIPINKITAMVGRVTPTVFSAVQDRPAEMRRYLLLVTEGLAFLTFPATIGLGLIADDVVMLALGDKWGGSIWPLRLLAFYATVRSVTPSLHQVLITIGLSRFGMRISLVNMVLLPIGFYFGSHWGVIGVAVTWIIIDPIVTIPVVVIVCRGIEMRARDYLRAMWPAASGCLVMAAAVLAVKQVLPSTLSLPSSIGIQVATGAVAYALTMLSLQRERLMVIRRALTLLRPARAT